MSDLLIAGGRLLDPRTQRDEMADILVRDGKVADIGQSLERDGAEVLDATGFTIAPGFVDLHTHVREPGREDEETIASVSAAAAAGGYTAICAMPNTDPVADTASVVEKVWALGREAGLVEVAPAGALSRGQTGQQMADLGEMAFSVAKVRLFTDDGHGVQDALFARRAMEYLGGFGGIYAEHCEDASLAEGGQMHEGPRSISLGLRGIPAAAEELMAARDIALARLTGCRLHLLHVSTAGTVQLVRDAKAEGLPVTAEATPHHFTLTDAAVEGYDPNMKVNPPLRSEPDRTAVIAGLVDGTIDAIATDHAPHALEEKDREFSYAPPGTVGLETAFGLVLSELVVPEHMPLIDAIDRMSAAPARILGLDDQGEIAAGRAANLVVLDPAATWQVDPSRFYSRSRNSAFGGRTVTGRIAATVFGGRITARDGVVEGSSGVTRLAPAALALEDGTVFRGSAFGAWGTVTGEVCFNTGMSGYQEILTDPSYHGQIVTMTAPQIGNTGVNGHDDQSRRVWPEALVIRDLSQTFSSWRATGSLDGYLKERSVPGIADVDTRRLTRHIRTHGAMRGAVSTDGRHPDELVDASRRARSLVGRDLAREVTTDLPYECSWANLSERRASGFAAGMEHEPSTPRVEDSLSIAALDLGIKKNILDLLVASGCHVTVLPASTSAGDILAGGYDGVFLSNGPGDPEPVGYAIEAIRTLLGRIPIFGICLGHQLLGLAAGGRTFKLPFGHRGANHPVKPRLRAGNQIEITCQNHGFSVDASSLEGTPATLSHVNLNDGTVEGLVIEGAAFSVQYHPEAGPGPHDSRYLFSQFRELIATFEPAEVALGVPA